MNEVPNDKYIKQLANGNTAFQEHLLGVMKREFPEEKKLFSTLYNQKKYLQTAEIVHKLKNKIGILGLEQGYQVAVDFEKELKNEKTVLYPKFIVILENIEDFITTL